MGSLPDSEEFLGSKFVDAIKRQVENFWDEGEYFDAEPTVPDFEQMDSQPDYSVLWNSSAHLLDECKRVFFRLTQYPDGALIPLWDLIDDKSQPSKKDYAGPDPKYMSYVIIWQLLAWAAMDASPPMPFDLKNAVFTKTSDTFEAIQHLLQGFASWNELGKKP